MTSECEFFSMLSQMRVSKNQNNAAFVFSLDPVKMLA